MNTFPKFSGSKSKTIEDVLNGPDTLVMEAIQKGIDRYVQPLENRTGHLGHRGHTEGDRQVRSTPRE